MNILLIRLRMIGDVVFTTPAIRALRRRFPEARLTYLVEHAAAPVVAGNPHIDEVIAVPLTSGLARLRDDWRIGRDLRRRRFDLVIDFHGGPRGSWLSWLTRAPERLGYTVIGRSWMYTRAIERPRQLRPRHSVENQWDLLAALGIPAPDRAQDAVEMAPDPAAAQSVDARLAAAGLAAEPAMNGARSMTEAGFHAWWLTVMGRLQPHATLEQANAQVASGTGAVVHEVIPDPKWIADREKRHFRFTAESGSAGFSYIRLFFKKPLMAVFAMCGGILLLACLNLASLLMARGTARQKELATRLAMGATRGRLLQQLLVESLLIAIMGTIAGLAVAPLVSRSLSALLLAGQTEVHVDTSLDLRVFAFAALTAVVATLLVGLVPALQATSGTLNESIKHGQHATRAHEPRTLLPRAVMATEVALALMLVVGAGLLASSLVRLYRSGVGFDPRGIENIALRMDQQPLEGDALLQFYRQLGDGLARQPGVKNVSFAMMVPFTHFIWDENLSSVGSKIYAIYQNRVSPDYFQTMRIPLFEGRDFRWSDTRSSGAKIILNQAAVRLLFPNQNPLGRLVQKQEDGKTVSYEVIGVVGNAKYEDLRSDAPPTGYLSMTQDEGHQTRSYSAVVRVEGPAAPVASAARALVMQADRGIPAPVMTSMEETVQDSLSAERTMAWLAVFFGACALVVTAIGLYGTLAYSTARRTSEIGIRMALGARRAQVAGMVFAQNAAVAFVGTAAGLLIALLASRALASFLYGTSTRDPWVFAGSIVVLAAIASAASLLPALRAAKIDPMAAIRCE